MVVFLLVVFNVCSLFVNICLLLFLFLFAVSSLREHGQDVRDSLHSDGRSVSALYRPHPALVQEVARQRGQGGGCSPAGCHAESCATARRGREVLQAKYEGSPEVQRQLLVPAKITDRPTLSQVKMRSEQKQGAAQKLTESAAFPEAC